MSLDGADNGRDRSRVTLQVIAEALDVSTATVSLALRDSPVVAESTRRKVQRAARDLGYIYNRSAASLRTARTNILAVAFHDVSNPYFAEMLTAIDETVRSSGRTILLGTCNESIARQESVLSSLREYRPDGIIVCPVGGSSASSLRAIADSGIPIVQVSRRVDDLDADFVGADDAAASALAVGHVVARGHRHLAYVGGTAATSTGRTKHQAFRLALARHGLEPDDRRIISGPGTRLTGLDAVDRLLALEPQPTAILCYNDPVAFGVMHALQKRGLEPGRDVAVVGCDDVQDAALWVPPLTTVHTQHVAVGRLAAEILMRRLANPSAPREHIVLEPKLIARETTPLRVSA